MARTLVEIRETSTTSKDSYCCDKQPLLNIPLDHIVVDELHLMLRVTNILIENLVNECLDWDREDDLDKIKGSCEQLMDESFPLPLFQKGVFVRNLSHKNELMNL